MLSLLTTYMHFRLDFCKEKSTHNICKAETIPINPPFSSNNTVPCAPNEVTCFNQNVSTF